MKDVTLVDRAAVQFLARVEMAGTRPALGITANAEDAENAIGKIDELSPHHRALIMRDVEDWSCAEIAEVLGVSVGGVKTRPHRARLFIRKRLTESLLGRSLGLPVEPRDQRGKRPW